MKATWPKELPIMPKPLETKLLPLPQTLGTRPVILNSGDQPFHPDSDLLGRLLTVHRSCIRTDLIEHFKDPSDMNCNVDFKIIKMKGAN